MIATLSFRLIVALSLQAAAAAPAGPPGPAVTAVAVFNFQLTTADKTPEWVWLEKFLADQLATDFHRHGELAVVARDRMQLLAEQLKWAPEMATTDGERMGQVQRSLAVTHLVSGICAVQDGQVEIVGQVVDVAKRKELFRATVAGPTDDVLSLQKKLSAELLGWFIKRPAAAILPTMPVWTRSLPAARALYEGMDLFDRGRYAEAWLRFRQSSKADPAYVEAVYWTGRMYYFMDRYEHARRSFDRFVYLDIAHPRMADCVREYLHTYEKLGEPPETALALYGLFLKRLTGSAEPVGLQAARGGTLQQWLGDRYVQTLRRLGRHGDACRLLGPMGPPSSDGRARESLQDAVTDYILTGRTPAREVLIGSAKEGDAQAGSRPAEVPSETVQWIGPQLPQSRHWLLDFARGDGEKLSRGPSPSPRPLQLVGRNHPQFGAGQTTPGIQVTWLALLVAPSGQAIKRIHFRPEITKGEGTMEVRIHEAWAWAMCPARLDTTPRDAQIVQSWFVQEARSAPLVGPLIQTELATAARDGAVAEIPEPAGMLQVQFCLRVKDFDKGEPMILTGVNVRPEFEDLAPSGAIRVACRTTPHFRVEVDGRHRRRYGGLIGPLPAGKHTVRFVPLPKDVLHQPWETAVAVHAGAVTQVMGDMPTAAGTPWASWNAARLLDPNGGQIVAGVPWVLADSEALRLVWTAGDDLWTVSRRADEPAFSRPRRLPLPVCSAWLETGARCLRDESGRYLLTFVSDRDAQHLWRLYVSWSRDLEHWSAPACVLDQAVAPGAYDIIQDDRGRYVLMIRTDAGPQRSFAVWVSSDALQWQQVTPPTPLPDRGRYVSGIAQFADGAYVLRGPSWTQADKQWKSTFLDARSTDLVHWTPGPGQPEVEGKAATFADLGTAGRAERLVFLAETQEGLGEDTGGRVPPMGTALSAVSLLWQDPQGAWQQSAASCDVASTQAHAVWHPRWGYVIAFAAEGAGPYVMSGKSPDALAAGSRAASIVPGRAFGPEPAAVIPKPGAPAPPGGQVGKLVLRSIAHKDIPFQPATDSLVLLRPPYAAPAEGAGTVNALAKVATLMLGTQVTKVAIDATTPQHVHPDVLRWDLTGKGDFRQAAVIPRTEFRPAGPGGGTTSRSVFEADVKVPFGGLEIPVHFKGQCGKRADGSFDLSYNLGMAAEGFCRFGDKVHKVRLFDGTQDLRLAGRGVPIQMDGKPFLMSARRGDPILVDLAEGDFTRTALGYYGNPVLVDGALWDVEVSQDHTSIAARPYTGPAGTIRIAHGDWGCWLLYDQAAVYVYGGEQPVPALPGLCRVSDYKENGSAGRSKAWVAFDDRYYGAPDERWYVTIPSGGKLDVKIGSPLQGAAQLRRGDQGYEVSFSLKDVRGMPVRSTIGLSEQPYTVDTLPVVEFFDAAGKKVHQVTVPVIGEWYPCKFPTAPTGRLELRPRLKVAGIPAEMTHSTATVE